MAPLPPRLAPLLEASADTLMIAALLGVAVLGVAAGSYSPFLYFRF